MVDLFFGGRWFIGTGGPHVMFSSFLSSMFCINRSGKGEIRFSRKSHTKGTVICTTNDHIFHEGVPKILELTRST